MIHIHIYTTLALGYAFEKGILMFLFLFLAASTTWANFSGKFQGTGQAIFRSGKLYPCTEIYLHLKQDENSFKLIDGGYRCGLLQASFDPFTMTVKGEDLFIKDVPVGKITRESLSYSLLDPDDGSTYTLKLKKKDNSIEYSELWVDQVSKALTVDGLLFSRP